MSRKIRLNTNRHDWHFLSSVLEPHNSLQTTEVKLAHVLRMELMHEQQTRQCYYCWLQEVQNSVHVSLAYKLPFVESFWS